MLVFCLYSLKFECRALVNELNIVLDEVVKSIVLNVDGILPLKQHNPPICLDYRRDVKF